MSKETVYTAEVVKDMTEAYTAAETDEARAAVVSEFAEKVGATAASVRAKLVSLGVYKAKARVTKNGEPVETKESIAREIAQMIDEDEDVMSSLASANKPALKKLRAYLKDVS